MLVFQTLTPFFIKFSQGLGQQILEKNIAKKTFYKSEKLPANLFFLKRFFNVLQF